MRATRPCASRSCAPRPGRDALPSILAHAPLSLYPPPSLVHPPRVHGVRARGDEGDIPSASVSLFALSSPSRTLPSPLRKPESPRALSLSFSLNKSVSRIRSRSRSLAALFLPLRRSVHRIPSRESGNRIPPRDTAAPIKLGSGFYGIHFAFFFRRQFLPSFRRLDSLSLSLFFSLEHEGGGIIFARVSRSVCRRNYISRLPNAAESGRYAVSAEFVAWKCQAI